MKKTTWILIVLLVVAIIMQRIQINEQRNHLTHIEKELGRYQEIIETQSDKIDELQREVTSLHDEAQRLNHDIYQLNEIFNSMEVDEFIATAYTHVKTPGVADINGTGDGITRSGVPVREGLIAVDPKVIPLGTKVWVEGFGVLLAADTGGAIKGKRIDIFFEDRKTAINFGRQPLKVIMGI